MREPLEEGRRAGREVCGDEESVSPTKWHSLDRRGDVVGRGVEPLPVGHLPSERAEFRHEARLSTPSPQVWSSQGRGSSPAEDLAGVAPESGARLHGVGGEPEQVRRLFRGVQVLHGVRDERRLGMSPRVLNKRLGIRGGIRSDQDIDPFQFDQTTGFLEGTEAFAGAPQHEIDGSSPDRDAIDPVDRTTSLESAAPLDQGELGTCERHVVVGRREPLAVREEPDPDRVLSAAFARSGAQEEDEKER